MFATVLFCSVVGCTDKSTKSPKVLKAVKINAHTTACLAYGDQLDGVVDNVVSKCPACSMAMSGSPEHKAMVGDYEIHSCTADCSAAVEKDPNKVFAAVKCASDKAAK